MALHSIVPSPIIAIVISVTAVLLFGEIIPQALCTRYGLRIGASLTWLVKLLMIIEFPIIWPIAKLLDWLFGPDHSAFFRRAGQLAV
jgi:metal transporter CNNM